MSLQSVSLYPGRVIGKRSRAIFSRVPTPQYLTTIGGRVWTCSSKVASQKEEVCVSDQSSAAAAAAGAGVIRSRALLLSQPSSCIIDVQPFQVCFRSDQQVCDVVQSLPTASFQQQIIS